MMSKGLAVLFFLMLIGTACNRRQLAGGHLPPEEMAPVLADLHVADAYSSILHDSTRAVIGKNYDSLAVWTKSILAKHHLTEKEFVQSMDWYRDRPVELDSLYMRVVPLLEQKRH
jgi:hypothetical protein